MHEQGVEPSTKSGTARWWRMSLALKALSAFNKERAAWSSLKNDDLTRLLDERLGFTVNPSDVEDGAVKIDGILFFEDFNGALIASIPSDPPLGPKEVLSLSHLGALIRQARYSVPHSGQL
tara:strand:+ start:1419 stop:1781 length:363 start_codon:yes stop_codon:yes gene_type:complete